MRCRVEGEQERVMAIVKSDQELCERKHLKARLVDPFSAGVVRKSTNSLEMNVNESYYVPLINIESHGVQSTNCNFYIV